MAKSKKRPGQTEEPNQENESNELGEDIQAGTSKRSLEEKIEDFALQYKKELGIGVSVVIILILGYVGYSQLILAPMEEEASEEMFRAEWAFENDDFETALNGEPGEFMGFKEIADQYGNTSAGNLAKYYTGISSLQTGEYQQAINYLEGFSTNSKMLGPLRLGALGDAHSQLGNYDQAVSYYIRAAEREDNPLTSPIFFKKAGQTYEEIENFQEALNAYQQIEDNYQESEAADDIVKYISRVESKIETTTAGS